jgi:uncharacterized protein (TIGR02284 family)
VAGYQCKTDSKNKQFPHLKSGTVFLYNCLERKFLKQIIFQIMEKQEELVGVLNDLIRINNDRIEGYERAANESKDSDVDLIAIFKEMTSQSRRYVTELTQEVGRLGGDAATSTTVSGKIYRVWMDLKAAISGKDRESILGSCEYGEDVAQRAYEAALESDAYMSTDIRQMISNQKSELRTSHDMIKKYRDMHEKVS